MSKLDVAIVSFRSRDLLWRCLTSIRDHAPDGTSVYVVENGTGDGSAELVRTEFPEVDFVSTGANLGFAAGTNLAVRRGDAPFVLVLNPDTELREETVDALLALLDERPDVGIAGCRLEREDGTFDHASRRSFPTVLGAFGHFSGIGRRREHGRLAQYRAPGVHRGPVDAVNGAFMLIRRSALEEVGPFDEGFWMYMEDLDLCYRFRQAGWVTWYEPNVSALHVKAGTTGGTRSPRLVYAFHYGMFRFYRKHYARHGWRAALDLVVYLGIAAKLGVAVLRSVLAPARGRVATPR